MGDSEKNLADGKLSDDIIVEDVAVKLSSIGLGVIITLVDMIIRLGLELLVK